MSKLPAFQFYPGDWLRDSALMSASHETRGIWIDALCYMHFAEPRGQIDLPEDRLVALLRVTNEAWLRFCDAIVTLHFGDFERHCDGRVILRNRRMVQDEKGKQTLEKRREQTAARMRRLRARRVSDVDVRTSDACSSSSSSSSSSKKDQDQDLKKEEALAPLPPRSFNTKKNKISRQKTEWPEDLALTEQMRAYAIERRIDPDLEFAAWHNDCLAHARVYRDWAAAWRTRVDRAVQWGRAALPRAGPQPGQPWFGGSGMANLARHLGLTNGAMELRDDVQRDDRVIDSGQGQLDGSADGRPDDSGMAGRPKNRAAG